MDLKQQNILILTRTMGLGGTENVILHLCEILKPHVNKIVICSCGGVNVAKLDKMEIRHYIIPDITNKNVCTIASIYSILKHVIREENISVIHSHHRMAALYARVVSGKKTVRIVNVHNTFLDKQKLTKIAYKDAKIVAVGNQVKNNLIEFFAFSDSEVTVIYNTVKTFSREIKPVRELEDAKEKGYVLIGNIGRLTKQKGMRYFLKSIPIVKYHCEKVKFVIVGDGEERDTLQYITKEMAIEDDVIFLGYQDDVQNVMSQLDFIVLSSLWEGFPLTPIEAFSVGKTVVATAVDGTPEIVKDGVNGILVEKEDFVGLARAVINLVKNEKLRSIYEKNALDIYEREFSFERMRENYLLYYSLI